MRWLLDQGLPRSTVALLNSAGQDAIHVADINMSDATDQEILDIAFQSDRTVVTLDADFHALLAANSSKKPSVLRIRRERCKAPQVSAMILQVFRHFSQDIKNGCVITIQGEKIRMRHLPLR